MKYSNSKSKNSKITLEHVLNNLFSFYFVSRDPKITELLLQSQYPVVGVDSFMPVVECVQRQHSWKPQGVSSNGSSTADHGPAANEG